MGNELQSSFKVEGLRIIGSNPVLENCLTFLSILERNAKILARINNQVCSMWE